MNTKTRLPLALILLFFVSTPFFGFTTNPHLGSYLINLSEGPEGAGYDDRVPEIVINGTSIHTLWVQYTNDAANLFYRRSTDLGKTWDEPVLIKVLKYKSYAVEAENRRLAVEGEKVHICVADYDYSDNGTGRLFYIRSLNNGASFENEKVLAATSGGYKSIRNSFIKAANGNVAVAYYGDGDKKGTWALFSGNGGTTFTDTKISDESNYLSDLYFNGSQMIVLYGYSYYNYGLSTGKVWVSVSQNGSTFTTSKISVDYPSDTGERERCQVLHNYHYSPKIAQAGNNVHVVFSGYKEGSIFTTFYARSVNNANSFEKAVDIGANMPESLEGGSETVVAMNDYVYFLAASAYPANNNSGNRFYFLHSNNNGNTFSEPQSILDKEIAHVGKASLPGITIDPNDATGKTVYLTGNWLFSTKSVDGGLTFSGSTTLAPFLEGNIVNMAYNYMLSFMVIDSEGGKHWISSAKWRSGTDTDIFYRSVKAQPEPGIENKALYVEDLKGTYQAELVAVPSSESINFDSAMTAEVWIKFNPETQANFNILAKVNGYDGYYDQPKGYQIGFLQDKGKIMINAGIKTDKGEFLNKSEFDLNDNLWHHIAITYDANGGLKNFKLYINGLLQIEKTVTGSIFRGDGMLMIGSRALGNSWYYNTKYHLDDVRLWNRALTQEELVENQTKEFSGKENGLKLFLNFDGTFKDISGNGNDGIPVYNGKLDVSDFDPPLAAFEMYKSANEVSFNNKTKNSTSWLWDFGNKSTSVQGNPKYTYSTSGEYSVSLLAKNANSVTAAIGHATIVGLDRVEPKKAGNIGYATITVFGGGLSVENTKVMLRKNGNEDITGQEMTSPVLGALQAKFDIYKAEIGKWDVVVSKNNVEMTLPEAFNIVKGIEADCWVNISGRGQILYNTWQTYTINYGNNGNVDAFSVPLWLAFTNYPELEIEFVDFEITLPEYAYTLGIAEDIRKIDLFVETDEVLGQAMHAKVFPLVIPVIPANSSASVHFRVKTPGDVEIRSWMNPPWVEYVPKGEMKNAQLTEGEIKVAVAQCVLGVIGVGVVDVSTSAIPVVGAVWSASKLVYQTYDTPPWSEKGSWGSTLWNLGVTVVDCGVNLSGVGAFVKGTCVFLANMQGYAQSINDCKKIGSETSAGKNNINAVSSFDPNEMIGPSGFSDKNFIAKYNMVPYSVLFENKSEATAPAHVVSITDTLDLSVFDLSEFGFSSFGWGDTILSPPGNKLKEFSMDVDLRPVINIITRVSGKLDSLKGIVKWEFLSLNPETMNIEEDPFVGFLPPNSSSPEGEGFVSFSVGLKKELVTNAEIRNKASIVFDANKPIITNEYMNTLDLDAPESRVYPLKEALENHFLLEWTGSDKGSGVQYYSIYVLENDTLLYPLVTNTTALSAAFEVGNVGSTYKFYSIATDNVSHLENAPNDYDAATTITVDLEEFNRLKDNLTVWPNPVKDNLKVSFNNAPCGMYVVELISTNGSVKHSQLYGEMELQNGVNISVSDCTSGQYILRIVFGNKTETRKIVVQ